MIKSVQNEAVRSFWLTSRDALPGDKLGQAETDSVSMTKAGVRAGLGATIHPRSSWMDELQTGLVCASRVTDLHVNSD